MGCGAVSWAGAAARSIRLPRPHLRLQGVPRGRRLRPGQRAVVAAPREPVVPDAHDHLVRAHDAGPDLLVRVLGPLRRQEGDAHEVVVPREVPCARPRVARVGAGPPGRRRRLPRHGPRLPPLQPPHRARAGPAPRAFPAPLPCPLGPPPPRCAPPRLRPGGGRGRAAESSFPPRRTCRARLCRGAAGDSGGAPGRSLSSPQVSARTNSWLLLVYVKLCSARPNLSLVGKLSLFVTDLCDN